MPAAVSGLMTAVILGLARAFGEALAVAMVIGKMRAFPSSLLAPTNNLTAAIAADMGGAMEAANTTLLCGRWRCCCLSSPLPAFCHPL